MLLMCNYRVWQFSCDTVGAAEDNPALWRAGPIPSPLPNKNNQGALEPHAKLAVLFPTVRFLPNQDRMSTNCVEQLSRVLPAELHYSGAPSVALNSLHLADNEEAIAGGKVCSRVINWASATAPFRAA